MKNKLAVFFVVLLIIAGFLVNAQAARSPFMPQRQAAPSPDRALKMTTDQNVKVAIGIMKEADALMTKGATAQGMRTALPLYIRAGQMFETALGAYQQLGKVQLATPQDFMNTNNAMRYCLQSAQLIQKRLNRK